MEEKASESGVLKYLHMSLAVKFNPIIIIVTYPPLSALPYLTPARAPPVPVL